MLSKDELEAAALVYRQMPATPQYHWPLLTAETGVEIQGLFTLFVPRLPESVLRPGKAERARCSRTT